jgi:type IV pilus assembly protein PilF
MSRQRTRRARARAAVGTFTLLLLVTTLAACAAGPPAPSANGGTTAAAANLQLGAAYLQQGNLPVAKDKLERARAQSPRDPQIRGMLAMLYGRMGDTVRAEAAFHDALQLAPHDPELLNNYAVYLCSHGRVDEGVAHFEQAAVNPLYRTPWAAYANAGVCLRGAKRNAEAHARFEKAIQARSDYTEAVTQLVDLDLSENHPAPALARVQAFIGVNPPDAELLLLGWRAANAQQDKIAMARFAYQLQTEFRDSEQARSVRGAMQGARP